MISKDHSSLSLVKQCKLLKLHRSGVYYKSKGESALNLELMQLIDTHYMDHCYKGAKRMHTWLTLDKGYKVNLKRIERLYYKVMGLRAVFELEVGRLSAQVLSLIVLLFFNLSIKKSQKSAERTE